jgi:hypothetical protein
VDQAKTHQHLLVVVNKTRRLATAHRRKAALGNQTKDAMAII